MQKLRKLSGLMAALLSVIMITGIIAPSVRAANSITVEVKYCQSEARSMLGMINSWRSTGPSYRTPSGGTAYSTHTEPLQYDYALEQVAMRRAAELVIKYSHTRPDGTDCLDTTISWGENIAWGQSTAAEVFGPDGWREDNDPFSGQGHRRNMLGVIYNNGSVYAGTFTAIGIACVEYNGVKYWVQEFGYSVSSASETTANNGTASVNVNYSPSEVTESYRVGGYPYSSEYSYGSVGGTIDMPEFTVSRVLGSYVLEDVTDQSDIVWNTDDPSMILVDGNEITFVKPGTIAIRGTAAINGTVMNIPFVSNVNVNKGYISNAVISGMGINVSNVISGTTANDYYSDQVFTESPIEPALELTVGKLTLTEGVDYTVTYSDNVEVTDSNSCAVAMINGAGENYEGTMYVFFNIVPRDLSGATITGIADKTYTGSAITQNPVVKLDGQTISSAYYSVSYTDNVNAGTATVTITGRNGYCGSVSRTFAINRASIANASVVLTPDSYVANGQDHTPSANVRLGGNTLNVGTDYTVVYENCVRPGTASAVITGRGNYTGSNTVNYAIVTPTNTPTPTPKPTATPTPRPTSAPTSRPTVVPGVTIVPTTAPTSMPVSTPEPTRAPGTTATPTPVISGRPTNAPVIPTAAPEGSDGVVGFCERLYTCALFREAEPAGRDYWANELRHGATGASVAEGFFFSAEIENSGIGDQEFILRLYLTFMDREPAMAEMDYWMDQMMFNGMTRRDVFGGFIHSTEWANVCVSYGILSGGSGIPTITVDPSSEIVAFATRLYTTCLCREADEGGLCWWASELANLRTTGSAAAQAYFFSDEFRAANVSDREFVNRLYLTFMDRNAAEGEFDYWLGEMMHGMSRETVFSGFAYSEEFGNICASYGIIR